MEAVKNIYYSLKEHIYETSMVEVLVLATFLLITIAFFSASVFPQENNTIVIFIAQLPM